MKRAKIGLFWALSLSWGVLLTLPGLLLGMLLFWCGRKPMWHCGLLCFPLLHMSGGFSLGPVLFLSQRTGRVLWRHEAGHSIQNCLLGPLMPVVIALPSAVRYLYREYCLRARRGYMLSDYEDIWFERWASELGERL